MLAFEEKPNVIRMVTIPNTDRVSLDVVFYYGQNDFAFGPEKNTTCSVSVGDVIELDDGSLWLVKSFGFRNITREQFEDWKALDRHDRCFHELVC